MSTDHRKQQRDALRKALEHLARQYEAALMQSVNATDAAASVQAGDQAKDLDQRMRELEDRLDQLELSHPKPASINDPGRDPGIVHDLLRQHLHKIDFRHVERAIRDLLDGTSDAGRAGLLLFQRCGEMDGRLCVQRIAAILKSETDSGSFRHLPVELRPADRNGPSAVLRHLARHLGLDLGGGSANTQLEQVTATLCESLQAGSIVLLDIGGCDYLTHDQPAALQWIVTDFWRSLLVDLERVARPLLGAVTVIALLSFDDTMPDGALVPEQCCSIEAFRRDRLLEIELRPWDRSDVEHWLTHWGGLRDYGAADIRTLADVIMRASHGIPALIANQLLKQCAEPRHAFAPV